MKMKDVYIRKYSTVQVVKGKYSSAVYNFHIPCVRPIPNILASILEDLDQYPLKNIEKKYCTNKNDYSAFNKYISFLELNNYVFRTKQPENFTNIDLDYTENSKINNAIIEYKFDNYDLQDVLFQLSDLSCKHIEIRFLNISNYSIPFFNRVLKMIHQSGFKSIDFILNQEVSTLIKVLLESGNKMKEINRIIITDRSINRVVNNKVFYLCTSSLEEQHPTNLKHVMNLKYFCEAKNYNPYFNKKVCIDSDGMIKNYIMQKKIFDNVRNTKIEKVINSPEFRRMWNINHDRILNIKYNAYRYTLYLPFELLDAQHNLYEINYNNIIH